MNNKLHKRLKLGFFLSFCFLAFGLSAQTTFQGNGNTGFAAGIGDGNLQITTTGADLSLTFTRNSGSFSNNVVIYIDNNIESGRNVIDGDVNDTADIGRLTVSSAGSNGSNITFPPGFQARYAVTVDDSFGGLFEIPPTGILNNNELIFVRASEPPAQQSVGNFTSANSFTLNLSYSEIGLTGSSVENLDFVVVLMSDDGFLSNEGYGGGFPATNPGSSDMTLTQYFRYTPGGTIGLIGGEAASTQDGNYSDATTWANGNVPFLDDEVIINDAVIVDGNVSTENLSIVQDGSNTPSLTVEENSNLIAAGAINTNNFELQVNGTFTTGTSTINGDIKVGPTGMIDVQSGVATFNDDLIFMSDLSPTGTPRVGQVNEILGTLDINGEAVVEIFVPVATEDTRAFRFITSTVTTTTPLSANWQDDQDNDPATTTAGIGTHITGSGGAANGFDTTVSNNPSVFSFDNSYVNPSPMTGVNPQIDAWNPISDTNGILEAGVPYRVFVRGDRNYDLSSNPADPPNNDTRLVSRGELAKGPIVMDNLSEVAGYFSLIANPYQAIVDSDLLTYTNVNDARIFVWDPNEGTSGLYVAIDTNLGTSNPTSSDAAQYLMPGQAFFVETLTSTTASVAFEESDKAVEEPFALVNRTPQNESKIDVRLFSADRYAQGLTQNNAFGIRFDPSFNNDVDKYDASLFMNDAENIYTTRNGKNLMVELRKAPVTEESIPLSISDYRSTEYVLSINRENLDLLSSLDLVLFDSYLNTTIDLPSGVTDYSFSVDPNDPASIDLDRFEIQFVDGTLSNNQFDLDQVSIYPNPAQGSFTIEAPFTSETTIRIYNALGQEMIKRTSSDRQINIDGNSLKNGLYIVKIINGNQEISKKLIMK